MNYKSSFTQAREQLLWLFAWTLALAPPLAAAEVETENWIPTPEEAQLAAGLTDPAFSTRFGGRRLDFTVEGHRAFIMFPTTPPAEGPQPWVWFFPTFVPGYSSWPPAPGNPLAWPPAPYESTSWVCERVLASGFAISGVDVGYSVGNPQGNAVYAKFYEFVVPRFKLARKSCLMPVSKGGAMGYNWAVENPGRVQCIVAFYPATDMRTYPGLEDASKAFGMTVEEFEKNLSQFNPIDRLEPLAKAKVPIFHIHGDADRGVDWERNTIELARRYRALGGEIEVVIIPGRDHGTYPEIWKNPKVIDFLKARGQHSH
jgi:pimeloyl-ACP methyl ester carboxylesterase